MQEDFVITERDGIIKDIPITLELSHATVRDALVIILESHDLSYEVHPNYIRIVKSPDERETLRKYDLSMLAKSPQQAEELVRSLGTVSETLSGSGVALIGTTLIVKAFECDHREVENLLSAVPPAQ